MARVEKLGKSHLTSLAEQVPVGSVGSMLSALCYLALSWSSLERLSWVSTTCPEALASRDSRWEQVTACPTRVSGEHNTSHSLTPLRKLA